MAHESKPVRVIKAMTWDEVVATAQAKYSEELHLYKTNGGMCLKCGREKAEYPNGINPFHCPKCNAETAEILKKLAGPGFTGMRID